MDSFIRSQVHELQNKDILRFISNLNRHCHAIETRSPPQRAYRGGRNPVLAACMEQISRFKNSNLSFHDTPATNETQKLLVHVKINPRSSTARIKFRKVIQVHNNLFI